MQFCGYYFVSKGIALRRVGQLTSGCCIYSKFRCMYLIFSYLACAIRKLNLGSGHWGSTVAGAKSDLVDRMPQRSSMCDLIRIVQCPEIARRAMRQNVWFASDAKKTKSAMDSLDKCRAQQWCPKLVLTSNDDMFAIQTLVAAWFAMRLRAMPRLSVMWVDWWGWSERVCVCVCVCVSLSVSCICLR